MAEVVIVVNDTPVQVSVDVEQTLQEVIVQLPGKGEKGDPGEQGAPGNTNTYIQETEPTPEIGSGFFVWYVVEDDVVTDIRYGVA